MMSGSRATRGFLVVCTSRWGVVVRRVTVFDRPSRWPDGDSLGQHISESAVLHMTKGAVRDVRKFPK